LQSIKINELKNSRKLSCAIRFLEQNGSINLYLYEAIAGGKRSNENYLIREAGTDVGLVHTKNGEYFHLFFLPEVREEMAVGFRTFLSLRHPGASVFFGEKQGIERFLRYARMGVRKTREYNYMELDKDHFVPACSYPCVRPPPEMAGVLLPLQEAYEIEELGVSRAEIQRIRTKLALRRRLERGEITAIFFEKEPVALAGVNARYGKSCQIGSIYVVPQYRGRGIGRSVISAHVERLFEQYERVVLFVNRRNEKAIRLYERLGFRKAGELVQVHVERLQ